MLRMPGLAMPVLGVLGLQNETMGWGTQPDDVEPYLPPDARFVPLEDAGHFVHIEQPAKVAGLVLEFLGRPPTSGIAWGSVGLGTPAPALVPAEPDAASSRMPVRRLARGRSRLALHELRAGAGRALLLLHGLGERAPRRVTELPRRVGRARRRLGLHRSRIVDDPLRRRVHGRGAADGCRRGAACAGTGDRPRPRPRCLRRVAARRGAARFGLRRGARRWCGHPRWRQRSGFAARERDRHERGRTA